MPVLSSNAVGAVRWTVKGSSELKISWLRLSMLYVESSLVASEPLMEKAFRKQVQKMKTFLWELQQG